MSTSINQFVESNAIPPFITRLRGILESRSAPTDTLSGKKTALITEKTEESALSFKTTLNTLVSPPNAIPSRNSLVTELDNLKTAIQTFTNQQIPSEEKLEAIKANLDRVDAKYIGLKGVLDIVLASSQSRPANQTSNDKMDAIKTAIRGLYDNYFVENKEIVSYLANITNIDGNEFSRVSKYILSMKIPYQGSGDEREYLFINNIGQNKPIYDRYSRLIKTILLIAQTFNHMYTRPVPVTTIPANIRIIQNANGGDPSVSGKQTINITDPGTVSPILSHYIINGDTLEIYYKETPDKYVTGFSSPTPIANMYYDNGEVITEYQTLCNYIIFMARINKDYKRVKQIRAFYFYIYILNECFKFYYWSEKLIGVKITDDNICTIFNPVQDEFYLKKLYKLTDYFNKELATADTQTSIVVGKLTNLCPIDISFNTSNENYIHQYQYATDEYLAKVTEIQNVSLPTEKKEYQIDNLDYVKDSNTNKNMLIGMTLKAGAKIAECSDLYRNDKTYSMIEDINNVDFTNNSNITIEFVKKSADSLKTDYYEIGGKLQDLNTEIEKSRDKINAQVKSYDMQNSILKALDTRRNIYYVVFAIVFATILVLLLLDLQQSVKMYISLTMALILLVVNVINYYMKYDYIEQFTHVMEEFSEYMTSSGDTTNNPTCLDINGSASFNTRANFISGKIPALTSEITSIFKKLNEFIVKKDAVDMYSKLSNSLKNEKRNYEEHATKYKYKEESNKKSIDIMKHEIIEKAGYINLMSVTFLVVVLVYILYIIDPTYLNVYLTIAIVLTLINLAVYYIVILHPVRTRAKNKYWAKPAKSVLEQTS